jgi:hypothetical protein
MLSRFVLGAIVGGIAGWVWGEDLRRRANTQGRTARLAAADALKSVQSAAEEIFDTPRMGDLDAPGGQDVVRRPDFTGRR